VDVECGEPPTEDSKSPVIKINVTYENDILILINNKTLRDVILLTSVQ